MPTLDKDLSERMRITERDGVLSVERHLFYRDLEAPNAGADPILRFASALVLAKTAIPPGTALVIGDRTVYAAGYDLTPWPPVDADVVVIYGRRPESGQTNPGEELGRARISGGTLIEQSETDFDATSLALPFAQRTPIYVSYDPSSAGAPAAGTINQGGRVPWFQARSAFTFTRVERTDPSTRSRTYGGKTNADVFFGMAVGTVLCTAYQFDQRADGFYDVQISFAYDPETKWKQYLRYIDPATGKPPQLTQAQVAAGNGVKEVTTQGSVAFAGLQIALWTP